MPQIFKAYGYECFFWPNESTPLEPVHIHFAKVPHSNATKYWLKSDGSFELAYDSGEISKNDMKKLLNAAQAHIDTVAEKWVEHFGELDFIDGQVFEEEEKE